ncbi:MAG: hypothetical protein AAFN44_19265 [Pseudomonadota bacterium]
MRDDAINDRDLLSALNAGIHNANAASLPIDVDKYEAYLDDPKLSAEEREEIIKALWQIVSTFVLYGFKVHPAQQSCGQLAQTSVEPTDAGGDVLDSRQDKLAGRFNGEPEAE